jgi:hypothetical protein
VSPSFRVDLRLRVGGRHHHVLLSSRYSETKHTALHVQVPLKLGDAPGLRVVVVHIDQLVREAGTVVEQVQLSGTASVRCCAITSSGAAARGLEGLAMGELGSCALLDRQTQSSVRLPPRSSAVRVHVPPTDEEPLAVEEPVKAVRRRPKGPSLQEARLSKVPPPVIPATSNSGTKTPFCTAVATTSVAAVVVSHRATPPPPHSVDAVHAVERAVSRIPSKVSPPPHSVDAVHAVERAVSRIPSKVSPPPHSVDAVHAVERAVSRIPRLSNRQPRPTPPRDADHSFSSVWDETPENQSPVRSIRARLELAAERPSTDVLDTSGLSASLDVPLTTPPSPVPLPHQRNAQLPSTTPSEVEDVGDDDEGLSDDANSLLDVSDSWVDPDSPRPESRTDSLDDVLSLLNAASSSVPEHARTPPRPSDKEPPMRALPATWREQQCDLLRRISCIAETAKALTPERAPVAWSPPSTVPRAMLTPQETSPPLSMGKATPPPAESRSGWIHDEVMGAWWDPVRDVWIDKA